MLAAEGGRKPVLCRNRGVDVGDVDHRHGHSESPFAVDAQCGGSREVDATFRRSARRLRGVRTESHACWQQARNSWRRTSARRCSYPIPYAIGARIAPDYPGPIPCKRSVKPVSGVTAVGQASSNSEPIRSGHPPCTADIERCWPSTTPASGWPGRMSIPGRPKGYYSVPSVLLLQDGLRPFSLQRRVRRRACWPSWNSRLPARRRIAVAPRCLLSASRRRATSVASRGRTHRSSMSTGSNGFAYQVTHLVVLGVKQIERHLEELHEQALRIPRRRIFSVRWNGAENRAALRPRPGAERPPRTRAAHQGVDQLRRDRKNRARVGR